MGGQATQSAQVQNTSNQSKSEPHPYIQGDLLKQIEQLRAWQENNPNAPGYFPEGTVAPMDPRTASVNTTAWQRGVTGLGYGIDPTLKTMMADTLSGKNLDVGRNPYFQQSLDNINRRQSEVWADTVKPAIDSTFAGAGRTVGGLHGANVVRSAMDLGRAQAEAGIGAMSSLYDAERNRQNQIAGLAPAINSMDWQNIAGMRDAANSDYDYAQRLLDDQNAKYQYDAYAQPDFLTGMAQRYLGMFPGGQTLGSGTSQGWGTSSSGGDGIGSILGPIASVIGTGIQTLPYLGFASDRRMKTDINKLGVDPLTGLPMYAYRYKDDPKTYPKVVGPMAQDIEERGGPIRRVGGRKVIMARPAVSRGLM